MNEAGAVHLDDGIDEITEAVMAMRDFSLERLSVVIARDIGPYHTELMAQTVEASTVCAIILYHTVAKAELARRTAKAQFDAARYMLWSVVAIAITSGLTAFAALASWIWPNPLHLH